MKRNGAQPHQYRLESLHKGLEVINCFTHRETWSLTELTAELGQSKATVFRILHTLEEFGFVNKDPATARYTVGLRFHTLGSAAVRQEQLRWQALPPLQDLAQSTGETVQVGILYDGTAICVQAVEGTRLIRMQAFIGKRTPAHASALGKVLLAHLPETEIEAFLANGKLQSFTPNTITDSVHLRAALQKIRADGHAIDDEEMEAGLRCIGAPITDHSGRPVACIAISGPAARMDAHRIRDLLPDLKQTATQISRMLGSPTMHGGNVA